MTANNRLTSSLVPLFESTINTKTTHLILKSSSDIGVRRNFGRAGTRYSPEAIINVIKKFNNHMSENTKIGCVEVADPQLESANFVAGQSASNSNIEKLLASFSGKKVVHIGGGHDHISPLLSALDSQNFEKIIVINIDAHCDTRDEERPNSGTPFRDFSKRAKTNWKLYQYGIHEFANSKTTLAPLPSGDMEIVPVQIFRDKNLPLNFITDQINEKCALVFSLDVDGMSSAIFEGVSAVNHHGLELEHVQTLMQKFFLLAPNAHQFFGIYEYNPVYDNLSQKGSRALACLINEFWKI